MAFEIDDCHNVLWVDFVYIFKLQNMFILPFPAPVARRYTLLAEPFSQSFTASLMFSYTEMQKVFQLAVIAYIEPQTHHTLCIL